MNIFGVRKIKTDVLPLLRPIIFISVSSGGKTICKSSLFFELATTVNVSSNDCRISDYLSRPFTLGLIRVLRIATGTLNKDHLHAVGYAKLFAYSQPNQRHSPARAPVKIHGLEQEKMRRGSKVAEATWCSPSEAAHSQSRVYQYYGLLSFARVPFQLLPLPLRRLNPVYLFATKSQTGLSRFALSRIYKSVAVRRHCIGELIWAGFLPPLKYFVTERIYNSHTVSDLVSARSLLQL